MTAQVFRRMTRDSLREAEHGAGEEGGIQNDNCQIQDAKCRIPK